MQHHSSETVEALVEHFTKLPTVGRKTAHRLAAYVLKMPREEVVELAEALVAVKDRVRHCSVCFTTTDRDPCPICRSPKRQHDMICVVEEPNDLLALERTGEYRGVYHVLGGVISPLDGIGPDDLHVRELVGRISGAGQAIAPPPTQGSDEEGAGREEPQVSEPALPYSVRPEVQEVILAMNPTVEGDTTAYYIGQLLRPFGTTVTRIARGLPIGGDLEYADEATLSRALEGRGQL